MTITRTTSETKITELIKQGPLDFVIYSMQTLTSQEEIESSLDVPPILKTLSQTTPSAEVIEFGDSTLGIEIDGNIWAVESPHPEMRPYKALTKAVWQYLDLALGREINGVNFGDRRGPVTR